MEDNRTVREEPSALSFEEKTCAEGEMYVVHRGDSLSSIAAARGITAGALLQANPFLEPDGLVVGQVLCLPSSKEREERQAEQSALCPEHWEVREVREGESYAGLVMESGLSLRVFRFVNPHLEPGSLQPGEMYCAPEKTEIPRGKQYTLSEGEDLPGLALKMKVSVGSLLRCNPDLPAWGFLPGMTVAVP